MRNEIKIGILTILAVGFAFWGFKYVQGNNLLSSSNTYYAYYPNASGVTIGTPVRIAGMSVGSVSAIDLQQDKSEKERVKMFFNINSDFDIPTLTTASIVSVSMLGEMAIDLTYPQPCINNVPCNNPEEALIGLPAPGFISGMLGLDPEGPGIKEQIGTAVDNVNATLFGETSDHVMAQTMREMAATMANLNRATAALNNLLASSSSPINQTMQSMADLSSSLASSQDALKGIIDNTQAFTSSLSEVELQSTLDNANEMIDGLQTTLNEATASLNGLSGVMSSIQNGDGTLGKLINDDEIYANLQRMSQSLDTLATDFAERPYRYVPFKSRNRVLRFDRRDEQQRANEVNMIPDQN